MRDLTLRGAFRGIWAHVPNEGHRHLIEGAIQRAKGLIPGTADYLIITAAKSAAIEFKSAKGSQSDNQKRFALWCAEHAIPYAMVRSAQEAVEYLEKLGMLPPDDGGKLRLREKNA